MTMVVAYLRGISVEVLLSSIFYRQGSSKHLQIRNFWENPAVIQLPAHAGRVMHLSSQNERNFWGLSFDGEQEGSRYLPGISQQGMMNSWCSKHSQRVLSLILEPGGGSEILNLSFLLRNLWPHHVMVLELSGLVKESCKYLFSPSLFLWHDFYSPVFPQPFSGVFFSLLVTGGKGSTTKLNWGRCSVQGYRCC